MKITGTYFVEPVKKHGRWVVVCNAQGHYSDICGFVRREAAENAAAILNRQSEVKRLEMVNAALMRPAWGDDFEWPARYL